MTPSGLRSRGEIMDHPALHLSSNQFNRQPDRKASVYLHDLHVAAYKGDTGSTVDYWLKQTWLTRQKAHCTIIKYIRRDMK